jgi:hypothetical protein
MKKKINGLVALLIMLWPSPKSKIELESEMGLRFQPIPRSSSTEEFLITCLHLSLCKANDDGGFELTALGTEFLRNWMKLHCVELKDDGLRDNFVEPGTGVRVDDVLSSNDFTVLERLDQELNLV